MGRKSMIKRCGAQIAGAVVLCSVVWPAPTVQAEPDQAAPAQTDKAAQAPTDTNNVPDETELANLYCAYKAAKQLLDTRLQELDAQAPARRFLDAASTNQFDALVKKESLTPAENTEFQHLVTTGLARNARFIRLGRQQVRTDVETKEFREIEADIQENTPGTRSLQAELQQIMQARDEKLDTDYATKALAIYKRIYGSNPLVKGVRIKIPSGPGACD